MLKRAAGRFTTVAAVVLLASSCTSSLPDGPLGNGGTGVGICIPLHPGQVTSWGATWLHNAGAADAVIEKVSLVKPRHLRLVASYVVPITGHQGYGSWRGYPPAPAQPGVEWNRHTAAVGTRLPPETGMQGADLVTVLKPTARVAEAQAIDVQYREARGQYQMQTHWRFVILTGMACPDNWAQKYPG